MLFQSTSILHPHIFSLLLQLFTPTANAPPLHTLSSRTNTTTNNVVNTITIPGIYICSHPNWTGTCFTAYVPPSEYGQCGLITGGSNTDTGWWQSIGPDAGISVELYADRFCHVPLTISGASTANNTSTGPGTENSSSSSSTAAAEKKVQLIWPGIKDLNAIAGLELGSDTRVAVAAEVTTSEEKYLAVKLWPYMGRYWVGDGEGLLDS